MNNGKYQGLVFGIIGTALGGFLCALMIAECREVRSTHDAVIRMEENLKQKEIK